MRINKYNIYPKAVKDIQNANDWYEEQSFGLGQDFALKLQAKIRRIMKSPEQNKPVTKNIRRSFLKQYPYLIFYTIDKDILIILRIRHKKQKPLKRYK